MTKLYKIARLLFYVGALVVLVLTFTRLTNRVNTAERHADRADSHAASADRHAAANAVVGQTALSAVSELAAQVRRLGGHPVVEPSTLPQPLTGATGATGAAGQQGPRGLTGATGVPGDTVNGPAGPAGPKGDTGPAGPAGKDGTNGTPGADGAAGADGAQGPPGPAGYPDTFTIEIPGMPLFTCSDPDGDHAYTCTAAAS